MNRALPPLPVSRRVSSIDEALSIYVNQLVYDLKRRGESVTTLSLGEAFFDVPMFDFAALDVTASMHYSDSRGTPELRARIAEYYGNHYGARVDPATQVLVTAGSKIAIFMAMQAILDAGDEIAVHEPAWLSYQEHARLLDAVPRFIPHDVPIDRFFEHLGDRTRILIINNPNNPAGRVYTRDELVAIHRQCRERGAYLLVDEAYSDFLLGGGFASVASVVPDLDGVILVNSLSKNMGMSGWRIGYIIAAAGVINLVLKLNQHLITCAPSILQNYLSAYFDRIIAATLPQVGKLMEKRARVAAEIARLGLRRLPGDGTFYFFVGIENYPGTSLEFALDLLLRRGIAVVPGSAYGLSTARYVRISIGTETEPEISRALTEMAAEIAQGAPPKDLPAELARRGLPAFQSRY